MDELKNLTGGCHCKAITFKSNSPPAYVGACTCDGCTTRASNAAGRTCFLIVWDDLDITDPENQLKKFQNYNTDSGKPRTEMFCGNCGVDMFCKLSVGKLASVGVTLVDGWKDIQGLKLTAIDKFKKGYEHYLVKQITELSHSQGISQAKDPEWI